MGSAAKSFRLLVVLLFGATVSIPLFSQEVGRIDYLEGIVDIHRNGEVVELFPSDIGFPLEAVDTIQTGDDGRVEFSLTSLQHDGTSVSIGNNTAFRVESTLDPAGTKTRIQVFTGSISLKVAKLAGHEELTVRTESAAMGVRGTQFQVDTAPDGGVLVLCSEGRVSCQDPEKKEVFAFAGQGVEKVPGDSISSVEVSPDKYDAFRRKWRETRLEIFRSGAPVFLKAYIQQYQRVDPRFEAAYRKLAGFQDRLKSYSSDSSGVSRADLVRFRAAISPALTEMRSIIPFYRQTFYRLSELAGYVTREGLGREVRVGDVSVPVFFRTFGRDLKQRRRQIAQVEYWFKLYISLGKNANDPFGGDSLMDEFFAPGESSLLEEF